MESFVVKIGGIGILQKTDVQKSVPNFSLAKIFAPIISGTWNHCQLLGEHSENSAQI